MKKITSYNYRKIIGLCFIGLTILMLLIPTIIPLDYTNKSLWASLFVGSLQPYQRACVITCISLILLVIILTISQIPCVLKKGRRNHYFLQALVSLVLIGLLIYNRFSVVFNFGQIVLLICSLIINLCASAYYVLCIIFNYDEMYFVPEILFEEPKEENPKQEEERQE